MHGLGGGKVGDNIKILPIATVYAENDGSFNVYDDIRQKLIARGVPADEIRFIHEADTEAKKLELFKKVRRGDVRILMGSTQKMGAGTNVQNKLAASSISTARGVPLTWNSGSAEVSGKATKMQRFTSTFRDGRNL